MQLRTKQLIAVGLLLIVAMPVILSVSIFVKQKIVHLQRSRRFEKEHIQSITLSAENVYWVKPGKEISVNGKLFDVKSYERLGNKIRFTGFYDRKEDKLVKHFTKLVHNDDDARRTPAQALVKFICFPIYNETNGFSLQHNWKLINRRFPEYAEALSSLDFAAPLPPPKFC